MESKNTMPLQIYKQVIIHRSPKVILEIGFPAKYRKIPRKVPGI